MPDSPLQAAVPIVMFPLRLEIRHDASKRSAQIRWYPDACQARTTETSLRCGPGGQIRSMSRRLEQRLGYPLAEAADLRRFFTLALAPPQSADAALAQFAQDIGTVDPPPRQYKLQRKSGETLECEWRVFRFSAEELAICIRERSEPFEQYVAYGDSCPALPERVLLYTLNAAGEVALLAEGAPIDRELVRLAMPGIESNSSVSRWMWDVEAAIKSGMAVSIMGTQFDQLAAARWLLAVGYRLDTESEVAGILHDQKARGGLGILRQGTPTNRAGAATGATRPGGAGGFRTDGELLADCFKGTGGLWEKDDENALLMEHDVVRQVNASLWDGCMGHLLQPQGPLSTAEYEDLRSRFIHHVRGRGLLPALRIRDNAYGVLVTMANDALGDEGLLKLIAHAPGDPAALRFGLIGRALSHSRSVHRHAQGAAATHSAYVASGSSSSFAEFIGQKGEVIHDDSKNEIERLLSTLRQEAVSSRCDVLTVETTAAGTSVEHAQPVGHTGLADYNQLPDEKSGLALEGLPLLLRLIVLSELRTPEAERPRFRASVRALFDLYRERLGELETLATEALDCLSYRLDAWVTAEAVARLKEFLATPSAPAADRAIGVFGWLERPIGPASSPSTFEYHQAPSLNHAAALAILRAGSLTTDSAYRINLSAARARAATTFVRQVSSGIPAAEVLGTQVVRSFHAKNADLILLKLRGRQPFGVGQGDGAYAVDGETFVRCNFENPEANPDELKKIVLEIKQRLDESEYRTLVTVWKELREGVDAVADLSVAEAVYQYNLGNLPAVKGWLEAVEGRVAPALPEVLQTPLPTRNEQQRVLLMMEHVEQGDPASSARGLVEPSLALFCEKLIPIAPTIEIEVRWDGGTTSRRIQVGSHAAPTSEPTLALTSMDLVLGGRVEVERRLRLWVLRDMILNAARGEGKPPSELLARAGELGVSMSSSQGNARWDESFATAARMAALIHNGTPLQSSDLAVESVAASNKEEAERQELHHQKTSAMHAAHRLSALLRRVPPAMGWLDALAGRIVAVEGRLQEPEPKEAWVAAYVELADEATRLRMGNLLDELTRERSAGSGVDRASVARKLESMRKLLSERRRLLAAFVDESASGVQVKGRFDVPLQDGTIVTVLMDSAGGPAPSDGLKLIVATEILMTQLCAALASCCGEERPFVLPPATRRTASEERPLLRPSWLRPGVGAVDEMRLLQAGLQTLHELRRADWLVSKAVVSCDSTDEQIGRELRNWLRASGRTQEEITRAQVTRVGLSSTSTEQGAAIPPQDVPRGNTTLHLFGSEDVFAQLFDRGVVTGVHVHAWVDTIANDAQDTAITFNYDTPSTEAPNAVLIAVPQRDRWQPDEVARAVAGVIDLMRLRTLASDEILAEPRVGASLPAVELHSAPGVRGRKATQPDRPLTVDPSHLHRDDDLVSTDTFFRSE